VSEPLDFREVFARHWLPYQERHGARIPLAHRKAAAAILSCRTPALGGSLYQCSGCGKPHYAYHSCNHRNCPLCGYQDALDWAEKQKQKLLPVPYSMVTFTVPQEMRAVMRSNQKLCFDLFFQATSRALQEVAADPKYMGGTLGMIGVLHTWTRQLSYHIHIHYIVPQGGLSPKGSWVRTKDPKGFLPLRRLSIKTRRFMQRSLKAVDRKLYDTISNAVWYKGWNVNRGVAGRGAHAISYLSRYVSQTALSKKRILADNGKTVTIQYTESKTGKHKPLHLPSNEFVRRFLQHVLPKKFKRVRYYGWRSPAAHKQLARIQALLDWNPKLDRDPTEPRPALMCRECEEGELVYVKGWHRGRAPPQLEKIAIPLYE